MTICLAVPSSPGLNSHPHYHFEINEWLSVAVQYNITRNFGLEEPRFEDEICLPKLKFALKAWDRDMSWAVPDIQYDMYQDNNQQYVHHTMTNIDFVITSLNGAYICLHN